MGLDSYFRKNLEQRAKENDRAIDMQWIKENETNDMLYTKNTGQNSYNNGLLGFPGGLDKDLQEMVLKAQQGTTETEMMGLKDFSGGLDQNLQEKVNATRQMTDEERQNMINDIFATLDDAIEIASEEEHHRTR